MSGRVALVTGAGSGLGKASAACLARAGAKLCIVDINETRLRETEKELSANSPDVLAIHADLSGAEACRAAVESCVSHFGRLDALCHVAGLIRFDHTPQMSESDYHLIQNVNLAGAFFLSQAAIPHLLKVDGAIVNVASSAAFIGEAYAAAYCASKAGLVGMTKAMAMEYMHEPIRINAVAPGGMHTNIAEDIVWPSGMDRSLVDRFAGLRGLVDVDDVADMIAHLASPDGKGFHGNCVVIDRGVTAG
ncbi:SDR family NAD(P)-dependent oxidoreductase [Pontixanthobacter aquaemixtae]|nr:SDR family oxidoreductase [Pontixanthobacter aquaemixtae]